MQPVTPPRPRTRSSTQQNSQFRTALRTPTATPFGKKLDLNSKPPLQPTSPPSQQSFNILTPPQTTVSSRKVKDHLGDALIFLPSSTTQRSLFPPTPSTIGSGRTKNLTNTSNNVSVHLVSPLKSNKSPFAALESGSPLAAPTKRRLVFTSDSDEEDLTVSNSKLNTKVGEPGTPNSKIINDDLIKKWNEDPFDSDDEETEIFIRKGNLQNPFITSPNDKKEPVIKRNLAKQTEITLINKKGEKIIRTLTKEEQAYKPRNLFGSLNNVKTKIEVYRDDR